METLAWAEREFADDVFDGLEWPEIALTRCRFTRCRFRGVQMGEAQIRDCQFEECDFTGARMNALECAQSSFSNCVFTSAYLFLARFDTCRLLGASFAEADLSGLTITGGDWSWCSLRHQDLSGQDLQGLKLVGVDFYGANLKKADMRKCDLTEANFDQSILTGVDFRGATLDKVDLRGLDLKGVRMDMAPDGAAGTVLWGKGRLGFPRLNPWATEVHPPPARAKISFHKGLFLCPRRRGFAFLQPRRSERGI